ncbi:MAG: hypothetical protein WEC84_00185 [Candidatus Andersenbacteria bacterium]
MDNRTKGVRVALLVAVPFAAALLLQSTTDRLGNFEKLPAVFELMYLAILSFVLLFATIFLFQVLREKAKFFYMILYFIYSMLIVAVYHTSLPDKEIVFAIYVVFIIVVEMIALLLIARWRGVGMPRVSSTKVVVFGSIVLALALVELLIMITVPPGGYGSIVPDLFPSILFTYSLPSLLKSLSNSGIGPTILASVPPWLYIIMQTLLVLATIYGIRKVKRDNSFAGKIFLSLYGLNYLVSLIAIVGVFVVFSGVN